MVVFRWSFLLSIVGSEEADRTGHTLPSGHYDLYNRSQPILAWQVGDSFHSAKTSLEGVIGNITIHSLDEENK